MKKAIIALVGVVVLGFIIYAMSGGSGEVTEPTPVVPVETATSTQPVVEGPMTVIGKSVQGRDIVAYNYGTGDTRVLFVGGLHGGYEWNTSLVAYETMSFLEKNPTAIPAGVKVTVIPVANPDGLSKVVSTTGVFTKADVKGSQDVQISGRFNANNVDLNRNFDCDWQSTGMWQNKKVSGGSAAFSEPESMALKNFVESKNPTSVIVWYSAAGGVFSSNCHTGVLAETRALTNVYAKASGYPANESFDFYEITGDMVNWLAKKGIPAISVLLTNHTDTEWTKNEAGVKAVLNYYAK